MTSRDYISLLFHLLFVIIVNALGSLSPNLTGMGKRKDKDGPTAPKKVSTIPPLPWTAAKSMLVWTLLTEVEKAENFKVLFEKRTKGEVSN